MPADLQRRRRQAAEASGDASVGVQTVAAAAEELSASIMEHYTSRVIQGIIAGVGFLGAGTILKGDGDNQVKGLTTAAGIWLTAAIGVAAGLGHEATAVLSTVLALAVLWLIPVLHGATLGRWRGKQR